VLKVTVDILLALDSGNLLSLLDLSAVFDTVDHHTLLQRLQTSSTQVTMHTRITVYTAMQTDRFAIDATDLLLHGEDVEQCLGWMFTDAVASVDHRFARVFGRHLRHNQQQPISFNVAQTAF